MKIVINRKFGGFGLSNEAYLNLIEWGIPVRGYIEQEHDPVTHLYLRQPLNDGEVIFDRELEDQTGLLKALGKLDGSRYWDLWINENRSHPLLLRVIEELGDTANGRCAKLRIIEVPDDVEWEIHDYDGMETVAEKHRTWA